MTTPVIPVIAHLPASFVENKERSSITGFLWDSSPETTPNWHHHCRGQFKGSSTGPDRVHTNQGERLKVWLH